MRGGIEIGTQRERERETQTDADRDKERDGQRDIETQTEKETQGQRERIQRRYIMKDAQQSENYTLNSVDTLPLFK